MKRFWLLFKKQWVENRKLYLYGALALIGIMSALFLYNILTGGLIEETQEVLLTLGLIFSGSVFTSTILSQFSNKIKGIEALMLPASALEKLAVALVYSLLILPFIYLLLVYPLLMLANYIDGEIAGNLTLLYRFTFDSSEKGLLLIFIYLQSFVLLFSVVFRRFIFLKTVVLVCVVTFGLAFVNNAIGKKLVQDARFVKPVYLKENDRVVKYDSFHFQGVDLGGQLRVGSIKYGKTFVVTLPERQLAVFQVIKYCLIPFLWMITWLRLREIEL